MTTVYTGALVDITDRGAWDQIIFMDDLVDEQGKSDLTLLRNVWGQTSLQPQTKLIVDPSEAAWHASLNPRRRIDVAFTNGIPKAWGAWVKRYDVPVTAINPPTEEMLTGMLQRGAKHLTFSPAAIDWFLRPFQKKEVLMSRREVNQRLTQLLAAYPAARELSAYDVDRVLGSARKHDAARMVDALGTAEAVRVACQLEDEEAIPLLTYFEKVLRADHSHWLLVLRTVRYAADQLKYDYKTAVVLFTLCCLQTSKLPKTKSASSVLTDRILDLYRISGIPC